MTGHRLEYQKDKRLLVLFVFGLLVLLFDCIHIARPLLSSPSTAGQGSMVRVSAAPSPRLAFFLHQPLLINQAAVQDLILLPGIGEQLAGRIIEFRDRNHGITGIGDLEQVPGIGKKLSRRINGFVTFAQP